MKNIKKMEQNRTQINKDRILKALESSLGVITTALKSCDLSRTNFYLANTDLHKIAGFN